MRRRTGGTGFQLPLPGLLPKSDWELPRLSELPSWRDAKRVGFDIETCDPTLRKLGPGVRRGGFIVGVSFALEDGPSFYLPFRHQGGDNLDEDLVLDYLKDQSLAFRGELVGARLGYDLDFCAEEGIEFKSASICDVQVAEALLNELEQKYSLGAICERRGLRGKDEKLLASVASMYNVDAKGGLWRLPGRFVGPYAEQDARGPLAVLRQQELEIEQQELSSAWSLEKKVTPILVDVRRRGVRVDEQKLHRIASWARQEETDCLSRVQRLCGVSIKAGDCMKDKIIAPALQAVGIKLRTTATGKWNIDKQLFASTDHPVADALQRARLMSGLQSTCDTVRRHIVRGRVHCTFNQVRRENEGGEMKGTRSWRMSCTDYNLQAQYARDKEIGPLWRSIYVPEPGEMWCAEDYSQQEPRLTIHYADLCGLPRAHEAAQRYRDDPSTDSHQTMADLSGTPRSTAKIIFLALVYGMGEVRLCASLGLPTELVERRGRTILVAGPEGRALLGKFHDQLPFLRMLARECENKARSRGYIKTVLGYRCRFPKDSEGNYDWTHKALNRLIQGGSAVQTKMALVAAEAAGHRVQIAVHDEFDLSIANLEQAKELKEIMETALVLRVPSKVDVDVGPSWGEAKPVEV